MSKSNIQLIAIQNESVLVHVCFVLFIVCLYICVCECLLQNNNHQKKHINNTSSIQHSWVRGPLRECRSIWSGASGLPYYCAPLVCVSDVMESLAVWRHNKPKTKHRGKCDLKNERERRDTKKKRTRRRTRGFCERLLWRQPERSGQEHREHDYRARLDMCVTWLDFDACALPSRGVGSILANSRGARKQAKPGLYEAQGASRRCNRTPAT